MYFLIKIGYYLNNDFFHIILLLIILFFNPKHLIVIKYINYIWLGWEASGLL